MQFSVTRSIEVLQRTPEVLHSLLSNLEIHWMSAKEHDGGWTPKEVLAHLIVCEKTNWMARLRLIVREGSGSVLPSIDMNVHYEVAAQSDTVALLTSFKTLRASSITELMQYDLADKDLNLTGAHPTLGTVNLRQIIATWVAHDLSHIAQISRILAKQYSEHIGPFETFLRILKN